MRGRDTGAAQFTGVLTIADFRAMDSKQNTLIPAGGVPVFDVDADESAKQSKLTAPISDVALAWNSLYVFWIVALARATYVRRA